MLSNQFEDTTMNYYFRTLRATYNNSGTSSPQTDNGTKLNDYNSMMKFINNSEQQKDNKGK